MSEKQKQTNPQAKQIPAEYAQTNLQQEQTPSTQKQAVQVQSLSTKARTLRNHQDTIFSSLYSDPECALDLYLTLHPEDRNLEITPNQVKLITLKNVFLIQRHNDVAFQIGDRLIVLVEHQSTINENMPLRMLFYTANEYEKIITSFKKKLYREKLFRIPRPEFYVVFTGKTPWHHQYLKLSDAYDMTTLQYVPLEVRVRVICEEEMQTTQNTLGGYYDFIRYVKDNTIHGKIDTNTVEKYIEQFVGSDLFKKFLEKLSVEEVTNMANYEFDWDEALEVRREEGIEVGIEVGTERERENGIRNLMETMKLTLNQAMDALKIPAAEQPMYAEKILRK